jgi:GntR family transcriptional regulator
MATEPMYRRIAEDLRFKIESGELAQGSQLPTEIELMEQYDASRNTVRDAIKLLTLRTLVETRPGQGTFVVEKILPFVSTLTGEPEAGGAEEGVYIAEVEASGRKPTKSEPRVEIQAADAVVADALRIEEGAQVVSRHQQFFIDGTPWSLQTTFYPMHLVLDGATKLLEAKDIPGGAVRYLAGQCRIKQVGYRDSIAVRTSDPNEMNFFRLPTDGRIQVFEIFRVGFRDNGERFRLTVTVYPADRNRFLVKVGQVPQAQSAEKG